VGELFAEFCVCTAFALIINVVLLPPCQGVWSKRLAMHACNMVFCDSTHRSGPDGLRAHGALTYDYYWHSVRCGWCWRLVLLWCPGQCELSSHQTAPFQPNFENQNPGMHCHASTHRAVVDLWLCKGLGRRLKSDSHYDILGVTATASPNEIKQAFRQVSLSGYMRYLISSSSAFSRLSGWSLPGSIW
jgi:hypothetical protein